MATDTVGEELDKLDEAIKELRVAYEKYFAGVERLEPLKARDEVKKLSRRLGGEQYRNTAKKFRLNSLQASLITFESYWNRITRQIEEGTFRRDKHRAQAVAPPPPAATAPVQPATTPATAAAAKPTASSTPVAATKPAPAPAAKPAASGEVTTLHAEYVKLRATTGETAPVSLEAFSATIQKQQAALKERFKCNTVDFKVAVKDGKVILKATPK